MLSPSSGASGGQRPRTPVGISAVSPRPRLTPNSTPTTGASPGVPAASSGNSEKSTTTAVRLTSRPTTATTLGRTTPHTASVGSAAIAATSTTAAMVSSVSGSSSSSMSSANRRTSGGGNGVGSPTSIGSSITNRTTSAGSSVNRLSTGNKSTTTPTTTSNRIAPVTRKSLPPTIQSPTSNNPIRSPTTISRVGPSPSPVAPINPPASRTSLISPPAAKAPAAPEVEVDQTMFTLDPEFRTPWIDQVANNGKLSRSPIESPITTTTPPLPSHSPPIPAGQLSRSESNGSQVETQVQVCIRVRPMNAMELHTNQVKAWSYYQTPPDEINSSKDDKTIPGRHTITQMLMTGQSAASLSAPQHSSKTSLGPPSFTFDHLFTETATNAEIFDLLGSKLITQVMNGYNSILFAYGQTSSGKTYTIHGAHHDPGAIPLAVQSVFDYIEDSTDREYVLRVAYLEVYNEVVNGHKYRQIRTRNLLNPLGTNLTIRESSVKGIYVEGLKESVVVSPDQVFALLSSGEAQRHVGKTNYNEISSRSHTIFQFIIESTERTVGGVKGKKPIRCATLNLVDLAGSENAVKAGITSRIKETGYINRSLLTLGHVIYKLSESSTKKTGVATGHIPYRDSKLTRLLQSSLSGVACVSVVCTISPSSGNIDETLSTLKFARRAKRIKTDAKVNEVLDASSALIRQYREEIARLKEELIIWKTKHAATIKAEAMNEATTVVVRKVKEKRIHSPDSESDDDSVYGGGSASDDEAEIGRSPSMTVDGSGNDQQVMPIEENALTAQIEQLTRLILTSSQLPRAGEASSELPSEYVEVVAATGSSSFNTLIPPPVGSAESRIPNPAAQTIIQPAPTATASSNIPRPTHASRRSVQFYVDTVHANNLAGGSSVPLGHHGRQTSLGSMIVPLNETSPKEFDLSSLPPGSNPTFYPTALNPVSSWTRSQLESHYLNLLGCYTNQLSTIEDLGATSQAWSSFRLIAANKQAALQSRYQSLALPIMKQIQTTLQTSTATSTPPNTNTTLLHSTAHVLREVAELLSTDRLDASEPNSPVSPRAPPSNEFDLLTFHTIAAAIERTQTTNQPTTNSTTTTTPIPPTSPISSVVTSPSTSGGLTQANSAAPPVADQTKQPTTAQPKPSPPTQ